MMFSNIKIDQMPTIKLGDEILEFVENHKLLGIILNKKMSWDNHIDYIYSSANQCVVLLQKEKSMNLSLDQSSNMVI